MRSLMELNKVLGQYELDWACHVATHKEYPYEKLKNKKVYVAGTQDFFSKAVLYFLFGLNDLQNLNIKITLVGETTSVLNEIFPALLKREDFTFRLAEDLPQLEDNADIFVYTGCCSKALERTPMFFIDEINKLKNCLEFAGSAKIEKFVYALITVCMARLSEVWLSQKMSTAPLTSQRAVALTLNCCKLLSRLQLSTEKI